MKATELRVNNWYNSTKFQTPVICEFADFTELDARADGARVDEDLINELFEPILLTEEWFLKSGFDERVDILKNKYFELGIDAAFGASFVASKNEKGLWEVYLTDCDGGKIGDSKTYIHQFQNLYFALTGEELTIK